jgi:hypothetical protein
MSLSRIELSRVSGLLVDDGVEKHTAIPPDLVTENFSLALSQLS